MSPVEHLLARLDDFGRVAVMHGLRREPPDPGMVVFGIVPAEELDAEGPRVLEAAKAAGKLRAVLERLELALGVRAADAPCMAFPKLWRRVLRCRS